MRSMRFCMAARVATACALAMLVAQSAQAQTYSVLHTFTGGADGQWPDAGLIQDAKGNFYGTTAAGGASDSGTVFKLSSTGKETVLFSFASGDYPSSGVILDARGNLYGTTSGGGLFGSGTVFKLSKTGKETLLYSFTGGADGAGPIGGVIQDARGNFYGTTFAGGAFNIGTVFKLSKNGKETVLYSFTGGADGEWPVAGLIRDAKGNLFGTTSLGGAPNFGTVFRLSKAGKETVLYSFTGGTDGAFPYAAVHQDNNGNLCGTTIQGGDFSCEGGGCGVVFKLSRAGKGQWNETVLHSFTGGSGSVYPYGALIQDAGGNFYSTTDGAFMEGPGTIFKLSPTGQETVLYTFTNGADGSFPHAGLISDSTGNFYGTATYGGDTACQSGCGTVFKLTP